MIHPIKISVKGFPAEKDIEHSFYNENDLMSVTKIIINDFPVFISENFILKYVGFYNFSKARLKINVRSTSPISFKIGNFKATASSVMKIKSNIFMGTKFNYSSSSYVKLFGLTESNFYQDSHLEYLKTKINQKGTVSQKFVSGGIKIISDKCYIIIADKLLGYWDDFSLGNMDNLSNMELGGTIIE